MPPAGLTPTSLLGLPLGYPFRPVPQMAVRASLLLSPRLASQPVACFVCASEFYFLYEQASVECVGRAAHPGPLQGRNQWPGAVETGASLGCPKPAQPLSAPAFTWPGLTLPATHSPGATAPRFANRGLLNMLEGPCCSTHRDMAERLFFSLRVKTSLREICERPEDVLEQAFRLLKLFYGLK